MKKIISLCLPILCVSLLSAQSLYELAQKEKQRRAQNKGKKVRVITNADLFLQPGLFGRISIPGSNEYEGVLVPDQAVGTDQNRRIVFVVGENNVLTPTVIRPGPRIDGYRVVRTGLKGDETIVVNDFNKFFTEHPLIRAVFFNGTRAQQEYNRRVLPVLNAEFASIAYQRLPSTSPAMASLNREQKLQQWKIILHYL